MKNAKIILIGSVIKLLFPKAQVIINVSDQNLRIAKAELSEPIESICLCGRLFTTSIHIKSQTGSLFLWFSSFYNVSKMRMIIFKQEIVHQLMISYIQ